MPGSCFCIPSSTSASPHERELLPDHTEGVVVLEELGIDLGEFFQDVGLGHEELALLDEGTDDIDAHFDGFRAVQDVRGHQRPVFGEGVGESPATTMGTGHNL